MPKLLLFIIFSTFLFSGNILKKQSNLVANNKGVIFVFESKTCSYCDLLKKDFYENKELKKISKAFNIYLIDKDKEEEFKVGETNKNETTTTLINAFMVKNSPNIIIFDKNWNKIFQLPGYVTPKQLIVFMSFVKKVNNKKEKIANWRKYLEKHGV